MSFKSTLMLL